MNAKEAKAKAALAKKHTEENRKARREDIKNKDTALLYKDMVDKIEIAVNAGFPSTLAAGQKIEYSSDRFENSVISDVVTKLREDGYVVTMTTHNAYKKLNFEISWI